MTSQERILKIKSFAAAPDLLSNALHELPDKMWTYKPSPQEWSVHEIIIHIPDSEASGFVKFRKIVAEPGCRLSNYDQDAFANTLNYHGQSIDDALELFRLMRKMTTNVINSLPDSVWANEVVHPEQGKYTLDDWLDTYEAHIPLHISQMKRNFEKWKENN